MASTDFKHRTFSIFRQLNAIPRPSHHERKVSDFLCAYARSLGLEYERDPENCVVIRKGATPGHEGAEPVVLLNHMDMVAVADGSRPFNPLTDGIEAYEEDGWMKARGTSLGADNGIGLSMALAVLADEGLVHGPIEVLTTTNEEDGMSGAAAMSPGFIRGRRVINLDSEDYDTITVGAAGAYIQKATFECAESQAPEGTVFFEVSLTGGTGGHSGVDIGKGRINAIRALAQLICSCCSGAAVSTLSGGSANASIPSGCTAVVGIGGDEAASFAERMHGLFSEMRGLFSDSAGLALGVSVTGERPVLAGRDLLRVVASLPCGVIRMHPSLPGTVMTSNNIGIVSTDGGRICISCHTRSFSDSEMVSTAEEISARFREAGATVEVLMNTPGWQEDPDSEFLRLTDRTFRDVLGFSPRPVAMHFVLEAGYYVQKFPGIRIACIGPRIVEPHSPSERVELSTVGDICDVLVELLERLG